MNPKKAMLISLGISMALIALGILFLYTNHMSDWYGSRGWHLENASMMGGALILVRILFWAVLLTGLLLMLSGVLTKAVRLPKSNHANETISLSNTDHCSFEIGPEEQNSNPQSISSPQPDREFQMTIK